MGQQLRRSLEFCGLGTAVPYLEEQGVADFDVLAEVTAEDIDGMVKEGLMPFMTGKLLKKKVRGFKRPSFHFLGNDINHRNEEGDSLLFESLRMFIRPGYPSADGENSPQVDIVEKLLVHGADPNVADNEYGYTPLMWCGMWCVPQNSGCGNQHDKQEWCRCMELLLSHGAHVNQRKTDGKTALHEAVQEGGVNAVQLLVQHGADVSLKFYHENDGREYNALELCKACAKDGGHEPDAGMMHALQSSATAPRASPPKCSLM